MSLKALYVSGVKVQSPVTMSNLLFYRCLATMNLDEGVADGFTRHLITCEGDIEDFQSATDETNILDRVHVHYLYPKLMECSEFR